MARLYSGRTNPSDIALASRPGSCGAGGTSVARPLTGTSSATVKPAQQIAIAHRKPARSISDKRIEGATRIIMAGRLVSDSACFVTPTGANPGRASEECLRI